METIICDIARNRIEKEVNEALNSMGLFVKSLRFEESEGLYIVMEISANESVLMFCAS